MNRLIISTPAGWMRLTAEGDALTGADFLPEKPSDKNDPSPVLETARRQLEEYFSGTRREFTVPLCPRGTPFRRRVWEELCRIPYGETRTYRQIAAAIGSPGAARAVGMANHVNPIAVFIPCHRVIGADGSLTGYAAGLDIKRYLLATEQSK